MPCALVLEPALCSVIVSGFASNLDRPECSGLAQREREDFSCTTPPRTSRRATRGVRGATLASKFQYPRRRGTTGRLPASELLGTPYDLQGSISVC